MVAVLMKIPVALSSSFAFEPEATCGVYKLLHLRGHVAIAGRRPPSNAIGPAQIVVRDRGNVGLCLLCPHVGVSWADSALRASSSFAIGRGRTVMSGTLSAPSATANAIR
jgi:hypothetical protein